MAEYRRPRHRRVARVLAALDAAVLARTHCCFGGGADTWLRIQAAYDLAQAEKKADKIKVRRIA